MNDLKKWYCSQTTGKVVKTPFGVVYTALHDLFKCRFANFKWTVVWLAS